VRKEQKTKYGKNYISSMWRESV